MDAIGFVIVASGQGTRFAAAVPKQFVLLGGRPLMSWSVSAALAHPATRACVIVCPPGQEDDVREVLGPMFGDRRVTLCAGGAQRVDSVRAGVRQMVEIDASIRHVMIHDAARPGLDGPTIDSLVEALAAAHGAAPALPLADALKRRLPAGGVTAVSRADICRVQTPQAFQLAAYVRALEAWPEGMPADDDLTIAEAAGLRLALVQGRETLDKVTYPADLRRLQDLLMPSSSLPPLTDVRTGHGIDVHGFCEGDAVTLAGIRIPHIARLEGHSDADAAWHALTDAILGAASLGDIGDHFPPTDPQWKDADSAVFLKAALDLSVRSGWTLLHADLTLICEAPRIKPHRRSMREATATLLGLSLDRVSIKATTTEGLGFLGRREGIGAMATATVGRR